MKQSLIILALAAAFGLAGRAQPAGGGYLIAHEWGTFTTIAGEDGAALDWRPLAGTNDLPRFVHQIAALPNGLRDHCVKCDITAKVRMETPVIYFYASQETNVSVKVGFPSGEITEWFPAAQSVTNGIDWGRFKILPGAKGNFPTDGGDRRYYRARETAADPVRVCGGGGGATEMEQAIRRAVQELGTQAAGKTLARYGRFAEPILNRLLARSSDPVVNARLRALLARTTSATPRRAT